MYRHTIPLVLGVIAAATPDDAPAATDEAFMCLSQGRERRIELQYVEGPDRLPCEVVYWRDFTGTGEGRPVWEAQNDFGFCIERTRDLVHRLEDNGWSCRKVAPDADEVAAAIPALAPHLEAMPSAERTRLDQALARDLRRLAQLTSGADARFEVAGAELGDLDRDGDHDAAVLLNYLSGRPGTAQFLMAYRFDGDTFQPTAKTYLGGLGADVLRGDIERIDDGTIEILLQMHQRGDQECCPSGRHRRAYVLQDGALVELRPDN
ncbi:MAG TPA: hypothetical protein VLE23_00220 [Geminicoccaceae bacterium]|nr:hypothetical protein [Geminicoccaceae bacterium]